MRKIQNILLIASLGILIFVASSCPAIAAPAKGLYIETSPNIFIDVPCHYNLIPTLRLVFPDKVWEDNLPTIDDLISGKQTNKLMPPKLEKYQYYAGVRLYLLPKQLIAYHDFFTNNCVIDPFWQQVVEKAFAPKRTSAQWEFYTLLAHRFNRASVDLR